MDTSQEITDDILSYLMDNVRESDSSFVDGDKSGNFSDEVSALTDTNPVLTEPISPSMKSIYSSKKLEWDSSADVGCLPLENKSEFKSRLSAIERMALSNSASKLCQEEDDHSMALINKIDFLLSRGRREERKCVRRVPTWPNIESSSGSVDTVVPYHPKNQGFTGNEVQKAIYSLEKKSVSESTLQNPEPCYPYKKVNNSSSHRSKCSSEHNIYSSNLQTAPSNVEEVTSSSTSTSSRQSSVRKKTIISKEILIAEPAEGKLLTATSKTTSSSDLEFRRLHKEALGELQVYRGLKDHLQSLKDYVLQLEHTWQFLEQKSSVNYSTRSNRKSSKPPSSYCQSSNSTSIRLDNHEEVISSSKTSSSILIEDLSAKSERSFIMEPLNLDISDHDSVKQQKKSKKNRPKSSKCCSHCVLNKKAPEPVQLEAQREPIAFEIPLNKPTTSPTKTKSLQEAFRENRPDFFVDCELRRNAIKDMMDLRLDKVDANRIPRLFTYQQLRKNTEKLYRQLPEFQGRNVDKKRKEMMNSNRIKAAVFQKKLQTRVLHGQMTIPHSTCL